MCCMATKWQRRRSQLSFLPPADDNSNQPRSCRYTRTHTDTRARAHTPVLSLCMTSMPEFALRAWSRSENHLHLQNVLATLSSDTLCLLEQMFRLRFSASTEVGESARRRRKGFFFRVYQRAFGINRTTPETQLCYSSLFQGGHNTHIR